MPDHPVGPAGDYRLITARLDDEGEVTAQSAKAPEAQVDATPEEGVPDPGGDSSGADRRTPRPPNETVATTTPTATASRKTSSLPSWPSPPRPGDGGSAAAPAPARSPPYPAKRRGRQVAPWPSSERGHFTFPARAPLGGAALCSPGRRSGTVLRALRPERGSLLRNGTTATEPGTRSAPLTPARSEPGSAPSRTGGICVRDQSAALPVHGARPDLITGRGDRWSVTQGRRWRRRRGSGLCPF
jgi:hypothetical protein